MPAAGRTSTWRRLRLLFRWCRIGFLLLLLTLLVAFVYLNQVGLPDFLKAPLQAELERRGADFQFERLCWHWYRGFVAEGVTLRAVAEKQGSRVHVDEVALDLNWSLLLRARQIEVESFSLLGGRVVLPLNERGQPPEYCSLDRLDAVVHFLPGNEWELRELRATFLGATIRMSGVLTHATALRAWPTSTAPASAEAGSAFWRTHLRDFVQVCRRMRFVEPPDFRIRFRGDARDPTSFVVEFECQATGASTPWVSLRNFRLNADLNQPPPSNGVFNVSLRLNVGDARTPWGAIQEGSLTALAVHTATNALPATIEWQLSAQQFRARAASFRSARLTGHSARLSPDAARWRTDLSLAADGLTSDWGSAHSNRLSARFVHSLTNVVPAEVELEAELAQAESRWGQARRLQLQARGAPQPDAAPTPDPSWAWWAKLAPFAATWELQADGLQSPQLALDQIAFAGRWSAPHLTLTNLHARLYDGTFAVSEATLDVATRQARAQLALQFDVHRVTPLLGEGPDGWLRQFAWQSAPQAHASVTAVLPGWTNGAPDWISQVLPTIVLNARVQGENATYREVAVQRASLEVGFSNQILRLRDFHIVRPEGEADLAYDLNTRSQEFRWQIRAHLDPKAVGPAIDRDAPRALALFEFNRPADVAGEVWGRWGTNKELNLALRGAVTNFVFRGEPFDELRAGVLLSDRFLTATNVAIRAGTEWIDAPWVGFSLTNYWVYLTNAESQMDALRIARVIGTNLVHTLSPYRFDQPPRVQASGHVPTRGGTDTADLQLTLAGGPFHFWRFSLPQMGGQVHWEGDRIAITNVAAEFYQGRLAGDLALSLLPDGSANFGFRAAVTNVHLQSLVKDTIPTTNRIEGILYGTLEVTQANTSDWKSWNGSGRLVMRDGLLWELPIVSILSPVLNTVVPGLGNSRAKAATGTFTITNSVIHTEDLAIDSRPAHLQYKGTLDFDWNVRARVEAEILPGAPLIGPILNLLFVPLTKAFIFKVSGTLGNPTLEPLYIPKFLTPLLRPFHTLKSLLPGTSASPPAPPKPDRKR